MRRSSIFAVALAVLALAVPACAGDLLDRIVATVNGHVILQSDWDNAVAWEAFTSGRVLSALNADDRKAVLDRLIDQELLREQFVGAEAVQPTDEQIGKRIDELCRQYGTAQTDEQWKRVLDSYGIRPSDLKGKVAADLGLMKMVDSKLRPTIQIDPKSIESYYSEELLPQLRQAGAITVSLDEATPKIKEVLTQQRMNEALTAWLHSLRTSSQIQTAYGDEETVR